MTTLRTAVLAIVNLIQALYRSTVVTGMNRSRRNRGLPPLDRRGRRQLAGLTTFVLVVGGCTASIVGTTPTTQSTSPSSTYTAGESMGVDSDTLARVPAAAPTFAAVPTYAAPVEPLPDGEKATVARVVDGDTFELADGRTVRVLGIDSCETDTPGGRDATAAAQLELANRSVILTAEPGVDTDRYDRLLRYVSTSGLGDFGEHMVQYDHTGVYQGDNDASAEYLAKLYANDLVLAANPPSGRECGQDPPPPPVVVDTDDEDSGSDDDDGGAAYYANCDAVRAAGAAPIRRGDPGYSRRLDRDGDGEGCGGD